MFLEKEKEPLLEVALLVREVRKTLIDLETKESKELSQLLMVPTISLDEFNSLSDSQKKRELIKTVTYIPLMKMEEVTKSRILVTPNITMPTEDKTKLAHTINIDVLSPPSHWETDKGPKPYIMCSKIERILRSFKYEYAGLAGLRLMRIDPLVVSENEIGYTMSYGILGFS